MVPEKVTVWLQSQDIIGLGFNICGNMSDGIFVSQVHNRGPAVESGKMQVGDRICSVTILYDKIVFEDALTILSYASPYPVQITLQKEPSTDSTKPSRSSEQLNHPLYRSHSLEAMPNMREFQHLPKPKRWQSVIKSEGRADFLNGDSEGSRDERRFLSMSLPLTGWDMFAQSPRSDFVQVHATENADSSPEPASYRITGEKMTWAKKGAFECNPSKSSESPQFTKKGTLDRELAFDIVNRSRESNSDDDDDIFSSQVAAAVNISPKTPPNKPERKKKNSSASIMSDDSSQGIDNDLSKLGEKITALKGADDQALPLKTQDLGPQMEEMCTAIKAATVQGSPPNTQDLGPQVEEMYTAIKAATVQGSLAETQDVGPEVEEEEILPTFVKRKVIISAEGFNFAPMEKAEPQAEAADKRPKSPRRFVYAKRPPRPVSPEGEPVEEEVIEAVDASRNTQAGPLSHSVNGLNANIYDKTKDGWQAQSTFVLDDEDLECLLLKNPSATASSDLSGGNVGQILESAHPEFLHQSNSNHQSENETFRLAGDFMTIDMFGRSRPSERRVFGSSHSDNHLEQQSVDGTENISLEWSGQRLVRSDSFSEIPQEDSESEWVDRQTRNGDDDDTSTTSGKRWALVANADSDPDVRIGDDLSSISDLTDSMSSSRSSSPLQKNGPVVSEVVLPSPPGTHSMVFGKSATMDLSHTSDSSANTVNFFLNSSADC